MWIFNKYNEDQMEKFLSKITDERKKINFIDIKNNRIEKYFPIYFTKSEFYTYINSLNAQETILFYKDDILDNDESSIQDIEDNSTIILFSKPTNIYYNSSLYKYIDKSFKKSKTNITIFLPNGKRFNFALPNDIKISLMIKFISLVLDLNNNFSFLFNGQIMNKYDNRMILEIFQKVGNNNPMIKICESKGIIGGPSFGKWIQVTMFHLKKKMFLKHKVCKYSPIKYLYNSISEMNLKK